MPRAFLRLDILQVLITLSLTALAAYLLTVSVKSKCHDCNGYYTPCTQSEVFDKRYARLDQKTRNLLKDKLWTALGASLTRSSDTDSDSTTDTKQTTIRHNYDWIGICQTAVLVIFWLASFLGSIASLLRLRLLLVICIVLNLIHIILIASIEISDDRDFPKNLFRYGRTIALYSILYAENTTSILVLKVILLVLFLLEYIILLIYFVLLRFEALIRHQLSSEKDNRKIPTKPHSRRTTDREIEAAVATDFDETRPKSKSPQAKSV